MTIYYTYIHPLQHILNLFKYPINKSILPFFFYNNPDSGFGIEKIRDPNPYINVFSINDLLKKKKSKIQKGINTFSLFYSPLSPANLSRATARNRGCFSLKS